MDLSDEQVKSLVKILSLSDLKFAINLQKTFSNKQKARCFDQMMLMFDNGDTERGDVNLCDLVIENSNNRNLSNYVYERLNIEYPSKSKKQQKSTSRVPTKTHVVKSKKCTPCKLSEAIKIGIIGPCMRWRFNKYIGYDVKPTTFEDYSVYKLKLEDTDIMVYDFTCLGSTTLHNHIDKLDAAIFIYDGVDKYDASYNTCLKSINDKFLPLAVLSDYNLDNRFDFRSNLSSNQVTKEMLRYYLVKLAKEYVVR